MPEFLIELYTARSDAGAVEAAGDRAHRAAEALASEGRSVRYLHSLFVPDEETCFYLYEAASAEDVRAAAERAGLPDERIVGAALSFGGTSETKGRRQCA